MSARTFCALRSARRDATAVALALVACASMPTATAAAPGGWGSLGVLGGSTLPDGQLARYQWDTHARAAWGAQGLVGTGRYALGVRMWRSQTVQVLDLPGGPLSPAVRSTTFEVLGRVRLHSVAGADLGVTGSAGRIRLAYRPDRVVVSSGPGGDVVADLAPVSDWTAATGIFAERLLPGHWQLGLSLDRRVFALDTAHRSGPSVIDAHERFGDWSTRVELAWRLPLSVKGSSR